MSIGVNDKFVIGAGFEIFNLGGSNPVELNKVIYIIEDLLRKKAKIVHAPVHPADAKATWASNQKATELLGWKAKVEISEGLKRTVEWYKEIGREVLASQK